MTAERLMKIVNEKCGETIMAADVLDDTVARSLVRLTVAVLWGEIRRRAGALAQ